MNQYVSRAQRQQAAQQWRQVASGRGMHADQIEAFAQQILSGQVDGQVAEYIAISRQQRHPATGFGFPSPATPWMPDLFPIMPPFMPHMPPTH
ncbi:hypothetical protein Tdes44962_MAKER05960 [Teratosphaeria destructans]|uniref:Uncharacterized protein n=1 Tax=Teratosphaeria destructans TaxID=418781 RepID=A0A9W7VY93_9PEZI|nr:hypothetical protein Tdes44962_MAKER05960 [Teratosphaeria destructans]